ncbi:MAG TPA: prepilin-type N-terminal cleavage/methylation domain-containing protein [Myxococcaceae bacterium]|nr:prepilin-type N-terminal cleavage/methylation domain-containing protein [Myxococcaceae bacterium]
MSKRENPERIERLGAAGFSLVELMTVVAITAILLGLALVAYDAVGRRGALQNAAFELQAVLNQARSRAASRSHPVWVIFHPKAGRTTPDAGEGAYLVLEDVEHQYSRAPMFALGQPLETSDQVSAVYFLEDYGGGGQVRFGALNPGSSAGFKAPFTGLEAQACGFCSGDPPLGAVVFFPNGSARFVDGSGVFLTSPNQSLAFRNQEGTGEYLFAISGPAAYIAAFSP